MVGGREMTGDVGGGDMVRNEEHVGQVVGKKVGASKKCSVVCKEPGRHVWARVPMGVVHGCRAQGERWGWTCFVHG